MKEWLTTAEVAQLEGISKSAIWFRYRSGKYRLAERNGKGRGGKALEIHYSELSEKAKIKAGDQATGRPGDQLIQSAIINPQSAITLLPPATGEGGAATPLSPSPSLRKRGPGLPGPAFASPLLKQKSGVRGQGSGISDKARTTALARLDLIRAWEEYRKTGGQTNGRTGEQEQLKLFNRKNNIDQDFIAAFNAGAIYPTLHKTLGRVSRPTLYRWKAQLAGAEDWTSLAPQYHQGRGYPALPAEETEVFMRILLSPNKSSIGDAVRLTHHYLANKGTPTELSAATYRRFAERFKALHYDIWVSMREGQKALNDKVSLYLKRDWSLLEVGQVLVADGHRLNFQILDPFTGKPRRATLLGYLDGKSYCLMGYEIMLEESTQCIASALRNSIFTLGKFPQVIYTDNGKAFRARFFTGEKNPHDSGTKNFEESGLYGLFARLGILPVFAQPYNAQAKPIERWFKEFTNTFERLLPSFVGSSIEDKPAWMLRNEKFHKALHNSYIPTIEEAVRLIACWEEFHRSQPCPHVPGKTIGEVFEEGRGPGVEAAQLDDLMMAMKKATIHRNGVRFLGADYYHDSLYGLREEVVIKYSLFDLSYIKIYTPKGEFLGTAERVMLLHPMAQISDNPKDMEAFKQALANKKRLTRQTVQTARAIAAGGRPVELDWQKVAQIAPGAIKQLEAQNISLPPIERQIPEEAVKPHPLAPSPSIQTVGMNPQAGRGNNVGADPRVCPDSERPFFGEDAIARYQWHRENGFSTAEDMKFKADFERDYRSYLEFFNRQEKECNDGTANA